MQVPYVKRHKCDPCSGEPATLADYYPLHFHRNADGQLHVRRATMAVITAVGMATD